MNVQISTRNYAKRALLIEVNTVYQCGFMESGGTRLAGTTFRSVSLGPCGGLYKDKARGPLSKYRAYHPACIDIRTVRGGEFDVYTRGVASVISTRGRKDGNCDVFEVVELLEPVLFAGSSSSELANLQGPCLSAFLSSLHSPLTTSR